MQFKNRIRRGSPVQSTAALAISWFRGVVHMVFIADYGAGNLRSVKKAFDYLGIKASVSSNPADMAGCQKVVLPGVGAFGQAIDSLDASGFSDAIREHVDRGGTCLASALVCS